MGEYLVMFFWRRLATLIVTIPTVLSGWSVIAASPGTSPIGCTDAGFHQFDFWIGQWDVFDFGGSTKVAMATITPVQGGCALREQYWGTEGGSGESLTMYDPKTNLWRQAWISNRGQIVMIEGSLHGASITLSGPEYGRASSRLVRGSWMSADDDTVREKAERSDDAGHTWGPWFDIVFRRSKARH